MVLSWSNFKLTERFGHELLIARQNKCSPRFNSGRIEMAASYESSVQPRRDGWSFRRDEWQGVGPAGAANAMNGLDAEAGGPDASRCFDEDPWDFWHTSVLVATIRDGRGLDHQPQRETHVARRPGKPQFAGE
jgi:hypothetical protein